ncbi:pancreatic progenitor cell differentiation and proliferation factor-like protein [Globicephala melas]|uniref:pancreatic progenitor cell differentiation and proliferation factor-like protein n=1 Tax=Pseudorca crassidens TaxID=82174 RepID=UPI00352F5357
MHRCWPPPHWPCSGDNGISAFHWMPLAPNQYYRKSGVSSGTSLTGSDSLHFVDDDKSQRGLPEVAESTWWFKSFFQSEQAEKTSLLVGTTIIYSNIRNHSSLGKWLIPGQHKRYHKFGS